MEKKSVFMLLLACMLLIGCAPKLYVVDPSWVLKPSRVKVLFTEPGIGSPKDLADDLPSYVNNFSDWYRAQLESFLRASTQGVAYSVEKVSRDLISYEFSDMDGTNFKTPKPKVLDGSADVYLVMDDLWIGRIKELSCGGGMGPGFSGPRCVDSKSLNGTGRYAFFDGKTGAKLGYGDIKAQSFFTFTVSLDDWINVVNKTVEIMLKDTPIAR